MNLYDVVEALDLTVISGNDSLKRKVRTGYVSDLFIDVLSNSSHGDIWITARIYHSIVAIAVFKEHIGIIVVGGNRPDVETIKRSREKGLPLFTTPLPAFEVAGKLFAMGVKGVTGKKGNQLS